MQGYIVYFNETKGYGFIGSDEYEENIFVHISEVKNSKTLTQGQAVEFNIGNSKSICQEIKNSDNFSHYHSTL